MIVTKVRVKLMPLDADNNLLAFVSIELDGCFLVRDLRVINGMKGMFVSFPSRKLQDRCSGCGYKNPLRSRFCNHCGRKLDEYRWECDEKGRPLLHADIAFPVNQATRDMLHAAVLAAYHAERELEKAPGYECRYEDFPKGD